MVLAAAGIWRDWQSVVAAMNSVPQGDPASNSKAPPEGDRRGLLAWQTRAERGHGESTKSSPQSGSVVLRSARQAFLMLCPPDPLSELLAGIKHAGLHGGGRDAEYLRAFIHRHLMVVDEVDDFPMFERQPGQCGPQ